MHHDQATTAIGRQPESRITTIYEAAADVFVREGYAGATSKALSTASGVAESTLFRLVVDKASLYRSLFDYCWMEINAVIAEAAFVADIDAPELTTDPAEILIGDVRAVASSFEVPRMRSLITFAFDALARSPEWFDAASSHPYARFRARLVSLAALHLRRRDEEPARTDPEALAQAILARLRSAWMAWHHTPYHLSARLPTLDEVIDQVRADLGVVWSVQERGDEPTPEPAPVRARRREAS